MYIDPHVVTLRSESDNPSSLESTLDSRTDDSGGSTPRISIRSLESSHPLIPTDTSIAAETTPTPAVHARKQPSLISSHIGIFLSAIIGICACLIFFYWLHGCFRVGGPARPRTLTHSNPASPRPGILARLRRSWSEARANGRQRLLAKRAKRAKERMGPCGCHLQARDPQNAYQLRDAGPAIELRNYGGLGGLGGLNMPLPVLGGAHIRDPSYEWGPSSCHSSAMFHAPHATADAGMQTVDITSQREIGATEPSIFSGLMTPARSFMRSGRRWMGGRPDEETYFAQRAINYPTQPEVSLFDDEGLRTPPPRYDEMYIDGSRRAF
ncbi:hypothetical protein V496_04576 [Pseudogymnoascus sp. VKM F-4515 (FW-2607)]|nr:hypothetical protein V496_04576 [Pseudogymnoascus sp. VKM F-4515 (FW-2607)]